MVIKQEGKQREQGQESINQETAQGSSSNQEKEFVDRSPEFLEAERLQAAADNSADSLAMDEWMTKCVDEEGNEEKVNCTHKEIQELGASWDDPNASSVEWTTANLFEWQWGKEIYGSNKYLFERKTAFVEHYSNVLHSVADKYDIPVFLIAGVSFAEYGGDPMWIDEVAYPVRSFDWSGPDWIDENLTMTKHPGLTSFGNVSIQVRRAVETLNYDSKNLSSGQKAEVVDSLRDPIQNLYIAAKHLAELKEIDFSGKSANEMTEEDIKVVATRYNRGPDLSLEAIQENLSYGNSLYNHRAEIEGALEVE
jgi:hypothetical protein